MKFLLQNYSRKLHNSADKTRHRFLNNSVGFFVICITDTRKPKVTTKIRFTNHAHMSDIKISIVVCDRQMFVCDQMINISLKSVVLTIKQITEPWWPSNVLRISPFCMFQLLTV